MNLRIGLKILGAAILLLIVVYFCGPYPKTPFYTTQLPVVPELKDLDAYITEKEGKLAVKQGNGAKVIWADRAAKTQTEYAVVYLHGFGSSHEEGNPVHRAFAKKFHCNLYLSRLADHGLITKEPMIDFSAERLWQSALEAYAIGRKLGKKVILMSTSTGGTISLKLAADYPEINSLILLSPNIKINNDNSWLLNNPWGLQIARQISGGNYLRSQIKTKEYSKYWYPYYRLEAAVELQELIETTMLPSTFKKVRQPVLLLYYYKDQAHQDNVVKVDAMLNMFNELGTPVRLKRKAAIPNAGNHVIGSWIKSKDIKMVERETARFGSEILKLH
ncbi:alpha/beta hydrolase [Arcticibacter eurypsychrophilus]|uniref:alpha/beta hydrolase n=1 Tax=Arcticibacter eurypsychrophilus TaxID=1434752 RepID=UPI000A77EA2B|nr:alpha/beta hydrolase [Arcticibacter eurypsychrophilus]